MSANNTIRPDGTMEMFSGRNIVPWHKGGTIVQGMLTAKDAIIAAKMDWTVEKEPISVRGKLVTGRSAIVRADNDETLGIMKGRYEIIQNADAFEFFDAVVGEGQAIYDTAGTLDGGRVIWILARLPKTIFIEGRKDDEIEQYVLLVKSHDGSYSMMMQFVATRVVCQNTLSAALREALNQVKVRHTKNFRDKKEHVQKVLGVANAYFGELSLLVNALNKQNMTKQEMVKFAEILLPNKKDDDGKDEETTTRTENIRGEIVTLFDRGAGNLGQTRWDALNAVTDYVDHDRTLRGDSSRFEAALLGSGAKMKQRAVDILVDTAVLN
jgi:phage/plasmid-like protein (TIGR03299 family)